MPDSSVVLQLLNCRSGGTPGGEETRIPHQKSRDKFESQKITDLPKRMHALSRNIESNFKIVSKSCRFIVGDLQRRKWREWWRRGEGRCTVCERYGAVKKGEGRREGGVRGISTPQGCRRSCRSFSDILHMIHETRYIVSGHGRSTTIAARGKGREHASYVLIRS